MAKDAQEYHYRLKSGTDISIKDLMAYCWLAASDENMDLSSEAPSEGASSSTRKGILESSKAEFTAKIAEIFRAHSRERGLPPEIDAPSCPVGTIGRLFYSAIYNPVAAMIKINPEPEFSDKTRTFMFVKFRQLSSRDKRNVLEYIDKIFSCDSPTSDEETSIGIFLATLNPDEFVARLIEEYGEEMNASLCAKAVQMLAAHNAIDTFCNDSSPFLKKDGRVVLERIVKETEIKADSSADFLLARAQDRNTHADDLVAIVDHVNVNLACILAVARNQNTDAATLLVIAQHPNIDAETLRAVARHPNTDAETLSVIAWHPNVDAATLAIIRDHINASETLKQISSIKNPKLRERLLRKYQYDKMEIDSSSLAWEDTLSFSRSSFKSKESYVLHWLEHYLEKEPLDMEHVTRYLNALGLKLTSEQINELAVESRRLVSREDVGAVADHVPSMRL